MIYMHVCKAKTMQQFALEACQQGHCGAPSRKRARNLTELLESEVI